MPNPVLKPFQVDEATIRLLDQTQLVQLVKRLVQADLWTANIPLSAAVGTLVTNVPDGGEDLRVEWRDGPEKSDHIPRRFSIFQMKADSLTNTKLAKEPLSADNMFLNPAVQAVINEEGAYILVTNKTNVTSTSRRKSAPAKKPNKAAAKK